MNWIKEGLAFVFLSMLVPLFLVIIATAWSIDWIAIYWNKMRRGK